jgi:hypothetical protein
MKTGADTLTARLLETRTEVYSLTAGWLEMMTEGCTQTPEKFDYQAHTRNSR